MSRLLKRIARRVAQTDWGWRKGPNPLRPVQWYVAYTEHADNYYETLSVKDGDSFLPVAFIFLGNDELDPEEAQDWADGLDVQRPLLLEVGQWCGKPEWAPKLERRARALLDGELHTRSLLRPDR